MADKRMFAQSIVLSDVFLDMPMSARCLYFTLGMLADDEGFVGNPKSIMRQCGATDDDIKILIAKRYVLSFQSGVIVIKHWKINNWLRKERIHETTYKEEKATLTLDEKGAYTEASKLLSVSCLPNDNIDKNSIDKNRLDKYIAPTLQEIEDYCRARNNNVNAKKFFDYYSASNWKDSKGKQVKNWKQKVITWECDDKPTKQVNELPTYSTKNNKKLSKKEADELLKLMGKDNK